MPVLTSFQHTPLPRLDLDRTVSPRVPVSAPRDAQQQPQQHSAPHQQQPHKATSYAANSAELFAHLQQFTPMNASVLLGHPAAAGMHPAVLQLGLLYADGSVTGANARCLAMLNTICQVGLQSSKVYSSEALLKGCVM